MSALAVVKPPMRGLRQGSAQWLRPELRVRVKHLKAKGVLRHATVKQFITRLSTGRRRDRATWIREPSPYGFPLFVKRERRYG